MGAAGKKVEQKGEKWLTEGEKGDQDRRGRSRAEGQSVQVFVGKHERQLDPKGRLALPASFRSRLEPRCYLLLGQDKCIAVVTAADSATLADEVTAAVKRGEKTEQERRALAASMVEVVIDSQGRVTLDESLRAYAGLSAGSKVVVAGNFERVEIWEPARFERQLALGTEVIAGDES